MQPRPDRGHRPLCGHGCRTKLRYRAELIAAWLHRDVEDRLPDGIRRILDLRERTLKDLGPRQQLLALDEDPVPRDRPRIPRDCTSAHLVEGLRRWYSPRSQRLPVGGFLATLPTTLSLGLVIVVAFKRWFHPNEDIDLDPARDRSLFLSADVIGLVVASAVILSAFLA